MRLLYFLLMPMVALGGEFTTSLGDAYPYTISAITADFAGNTYVVGSRAIGPAFAIGVAILYDPSVGLPSVSSTGSDVFVTKLDPNGKILFTDTFAGKGVDTGTAITLDPSGNIYIAGMTTSNDFPLSKALQSQASSYGTGFIIKLSNDGSTILYSTYFGGTMGQTSISSLASDSNGNLYLTGMTAAADFPHTTGMPFGQITAPGASQQTGAIIASISAGGDKILYSGALVGTALACSGGSSCSLSERVTAGTGIAVDASGNAYIVGNTNTTDLPTTAGTLSPKGIGGFIAKINVGGSGLGYLTYLGSQQIGMNPYVAAANTLNAIAVDTAGDAYIAGQEGNQLVIAKLKPDASALAWAAYSTGFSECTGLACMSTNDVTRSIAVDSSGNLWATGISSASSLPNQGWSTGTEFLISVNSLGSFVYSALYPAGTVAQSVAVDSAGLIHVAGVNGFVSAISPSTPPKMKIFDFRNAFGGSVTARISLAEVISIYGPGIGPATPVAATASGGFYPKTLGGVQVAINGVNIPLLYVSANQINAVVPMELATGMAATVRVTNGSTLSPGYPVWIMAATPQAFSTVLNQDGTVNSQTNPAKGGSIVTFYATGWQSNFSPLADGQIATVAQDACMGVCQVFAATNLNGPAATVQYGGVAPGIVAGVTQFNIQIGAVPSNLGISLFRFNVSGFSTVTQSVWVTP